VNQSVPKILVTRRLPSDAVDALQRGKYQVDVGGDQLMSRPELLLRVRGVHAILSQLAETIGTDVLDAAGARLRVVSNYAVGTNNIDVQACTARGVWVCHTPDVLTEATADVAWALLLAAARRVGEGERLVRTKKPWNWAPKLLLGADLTGATLAIVGPGRIGVATARRAFGWRMKLVYVGRRTSPEMEALGAQRVDLPSALCSADIVSLHVPLTAKTRHLIDVGRLAEMKRTAILINTARGPVVDEAALADALQSGQIAAAGLDVYEHEPAVHPRLLALDNVVLLPHIGSATVQTRANMAVVAVANITRILAGERPLHAVNEPTQAT
jgi:glyoxylate reductase